MNTRSFWRWALFAIGLVGLLSLIDSPGLEVGTPAARFDLPLIGSDARGRRTLGLEDRDGRPMVIEVFASWCGVCRRAAPMLARAHARHRRELAFVGVSVDSDFAAAERMKREWKIPYPVAHDSDGAFARAYQVSVLPTFILVDRDGQVQSVSTGAPSAEQLDEWARAAAD